MTESIFFLNPDFPREKIIDIFKSILGCDEFLTQPIMPYETTHHIDMWAKAVKKNVIMVAEMTTQSLGFTRDPRAQEIKKFLDNQAQFLKKYGFEVRRIPMPTPIFVKEDELFDGPVIRTYVNSVIINGWVLVPRYLAPKKPLTGKGVPHYPDFCLIDGYEHKVKSAYFNEGLKPFFNTCLNLNKQILK